MREERMKLPEYRAYLNQVLKLPDSIHLLLEYLLKPITEPLLWKVLSTGSKYNLSTGTGSENCYASFPKVDF